MYHTQCDWCSKPIDTDDEPYVQATIEVMSGDLDRLGRSVGETEPTRFFHVEPPRSREEWNRLGLEVTSKKIGDCCYTRALRAIESEPDFDTPDAGLEWRLMPVGETPETSTGQRTPKPKPVPADADLAEYLATLAPSPRHSLNRALIRAGISTLDEVAALSDDDLMAIPGVGWNTRTKLRAFIAARDAAREPNEPAKAGDA